MQIKTNVEVNHEEVLARLKPDEILSYLQKNHPTYYSEKVERPDTTPVKPVKKPVKKYDYGQWFKARAPYVTSCEYFCATYINGKYYFICIDFRTGYINRESDHGLDNLEEHNIPNYFTPVDYKNIPK
jgi:hypothetical protein